jgi:phage RecT family recombinase
MNSNNKKLMSQIAPDKFDEVITISGVAKILSDKMGKEVFLEAAKVLFEDVKYKQCTIESIAGALLKAAIFNFRLSPELGEAWVIPRNVKTGLKDAQGKDIYETVAVFQIGYKGWKRLAEDTGRVSNWDYGTAHSNEIFEYKQGTAQMLNHIPVFGNKGTMVAFWAKAVLTDGREVYHVIGHDEAEQYRKYSETQYDWGADRKKVFVGPKGIWATAYQQMALRMPFKEIATKKIPRTSLIIENAIVADDSVTRIDLETGEVTQAGAAENFDNYEVHLHEDYVQFWPAQPRRRFDLFTTETCQRWTKRHERYILNFAPITPKPYQYNGR